MDRDEVLAVVIDAIKRGVVLPLEMSPRGKTIEKAIDLRSLRTESEQRGYDLPGMIADAASMFLNAYGAERGLEIVRGRTQQQGSASA